MAHLLIYLAIIDSAENQSKFETIYYAYRDLMYYTANKILGDEKDSEDVVHDSFLKIIHILNKISIPTCPQTRALVVTITERTAIDLYRHRQRHTSVPFDEVYLGVPARSGIEAIESTDTLAKAIATLPGHYREILLLKYAQGYSVKEIADILSLSQANVKKLIQRAKKKLETLLTEEGANL